MSSPIRFRSGSKFAVVFNVRYPGNAEEQPTEEGFEKVVRDWESVAVRSILKDHWQDRNGQWRDSIYFYELVPGTEENRIQCDEFYVVGNFVITRRETDPVRAREAWKAFNAR